MRLCSYTNHEQSYAPRAAFVLPGDVLVDVAELYVWFQRKSGNPMDAELVPSLQSLTKLVQFAEELDTWACLEQWYAAWLEARRVELNIWPVREIPLRSVRLTLPFQPRSFRDFYAFEQHVETCRRRRGLDMVPEWYQFPVFYFSNISSFRGPGDAIRVPKGCRELDYELEVAIVIGRSGTCIPASEADRYIAGYLILNDWSARDIQREEVKVGLGPAKGKDFATSMGPYLVTPSELSDVAVPSSEGIRHQLHMTASVNGTMLSHGNLAHLHFTFAQMIERASQDVMLMPGDVIGSGTVGSGCLLELGNEVHRYLLPGDSVVLSVDRLGSLDNQVEKTSEGKNT